MKKQIIVIISLVVVLVAIIAIAGMYMPKAPATPGPTGDVPVSTTRTVVGNFICLPHKNASGPQTMECAYGIKADDGRNYALDWSKTGTSAFDLPMGVKYTVTGTFVPVETLNDAHWQIYDVVGIIQVTSYKEVATDVPVMPLNSKITMELGKPVTVEGTTIRITAVTQDSRCPMGVYCIQAGTVTVAMSVTNASGVSSTTQLNIGGVYAAGALKISLDDVTPPKTTTHEITDDEYRFVVTVKAK